MPPVIPDPTKTLPFVSHDAFYDWLAENHAQWDALWLKLHKKHSGLPTLSYEDAVRAALCWGWIDGIKKTFDENSYLLRFTPRRPRSIWSQVNTRHAESLIAQGRMRAPGLAQVTAAKADGRWDAAYRSGSEMEMPADFLAALAHNEAAAAFYETLNKANRYAIMFRINAGKRPETRARNIETFIAMLAAGETLHPNGKKAR